MKNKLVLLFFFITAYGISQSKKETVYLLFDEYSKETCKIETEYSFDNDEKLDGYKIVKKYRIRIEQDRVIFQICDEEFYFIKKRSAIDTLSSIKNLNIKSINYTKKKYQNGKDFKHHVFNKIFILEKKAKDKFFKYDVFWCCEWSID